jgi:hypothetical protein
VPAEGTKPPESAPADKEPKLEAPANAQAASIDKLARGSAER